MTPPLLAALRAGTADLHARTEAAFVLGAPGVTRREYAAALAHLHAFYAPAEAAVAAWADAFMAELAQVSHSRHAKTVRAAKRS